MSTVRSTAARQRADPLSRAAMAIIAMVMAFLILGAVNPLQARADAPTREEYFPMQPFFHDGCGITDDSYAFPAQLVEGSEEYTSEGGDEIWRSTHRGEFGDYIVTDMQREGVRKVIIAFVVTDPSKVVGTPREGVDTYWIDSSQGPDAAVWSYTYNSEPCPTEGPITQPSPAQTPTSTPPTVDAVAPPTAATPTKPASSTPAKPPVRIVTSAHEVPPDASTPSQSPQPASQETTVPPDVTPAPQAELSTSTSGLSVDKTLQFVVVIAAILMIIAITALIFVLNRGRWSR